MLAIACVVMLSSASAQAQNSRTQTTEAQNTEVQSTKAHRVGSYYIPGLVESNGQGLFAELHTEIFNRLERSSYFSLAPTRRTQAAFTQKALDAYFPELEENLPTPRSDYVTSDSFWLKKVILYSRVDAPLNNIASLVGKTLGAVRGYSYGEDLINHPELDIRYHRNDDLNVKMLLSGRIDAIIGDTASTLSAINNSDQARQVHYDLDQPIAVLDVFYVCHNTAKGRALCNDISAVIATLKQEGLIQLDRVRGNAQISLGRMAEKTAAP